MGGDVQDLGGLGLEDAAPRGVVGEDGSAEGCLDDVGFGCGVGEAPFPGVCEDECSGGTCWDGSGGESCGGEDDDFVLCDQVVCRGVQQVKGEVVQDAIGDDQEAAVGAAACGEWVNEGSVQPLEDAFCRAGQSTLGCLCDAAMQRSGDVELELGEEVIDRRWGGGEGVKVKCLAIECEGP